MASKNIKIRRRTSTGLDLLYPETKAEQIRISEGVDIATVGETIIKATPAAAGTSKYFTISADGTTITWGDDHNFIGAAAADHPHTIAQIDDGGTALQDILDLKVPIVSSKVPAQYWPAWTKGHMKFISSVNLTGETQISLETIFSYLSTEATPDLDVGNYLIVNTPGRINTSGTGTYVILGSEEGETTTPYLENGDWIVLVAFTAPSTYTFAIVNNTYQLGSISKDGIVQLSPIASKTKRSDLSTDRGLVVTEGLLRSVLKDITLKEIYEFSGGVTQQIDRLIATGMTHSSGTAVNNVSGTLGEYVLVDANKYVYECTVVAPPNYTWTFRLNFTTYYPPGGFLISKLYWWPTLNQLRYVQYNSLNTPLPLYPAEINDIFFD